MKPTNQYEKGKRYYWASKAQLACMYISPAFNPKSGVLGLLIKRPKNKKDFHRVEINVVRTPREQKLLDAKFARMRKRNFSQFKELLAKHAAKKPLTRQSEPAKI